jgi:hypothetical protein
MAMAVTTSISVLEIAAFRNSTLLEPNVDPDVVWWITHDGDTHELDDTELDDDNMDTTTQDDVLEQQEQPGTGDESTFTRTKRRKAKEQWEQAKADALREKRREKRMARNRFKMTPSKVVVAEPYDAANASISASGFMGKPFPRHSAQEIIQAWLTGSIYAFLAAFMLLPFSPTELVSLLLILYYH